jgi:hypothetical protein
MIVPVALITVLMLVLIDAPSRIYAQNTNNSTPSNAMTVESHPTNTTAIAQACRWLQHIINKQHLIYTIHQARKNRNVQFVLSILCFV